MFLFFSLLFILSSICYLICSMFCEEGKEISTRPSMKLYSIYICELWKSKVKKTYINVTIEHITKNELIHVKVSRKMCRSKTFKENLETLTISSHSSKFRVIFSALELHKIEVQMYNSYISEVFPCYLFPLLFPWPRKISISC